MQKKEQKIVGIVLSGGKSRRMGEEKGLVDFKGKALIEYAIDILKPLCDEIVISTANMAYAYLNLEIVPDDIPNCGPIGGISSCMKAKSADIYFVISCDVPHVPSELFSDMLSVLEGVAVVPVDENERKQPLIACYSADASRFFHEALNSGHLKMMNLLSEMKPRYFRIPANAKYYQSHLFSNLNSKEDMLD